MKRISYKTVNGKKYIYLQYKKNGKVTTKYLGKADRVGLFRKLVARIFKI